MSDEHTGSTEDPRRKRLRYQSRHRGTREMDLILGPFIDKHLSAFSPDELDELEALFAVPDTTIYRWLSGQDEVPADRDTVLFRCLKAWVDAPARS